MLDPKFIRENLDFVKEQIGKKKYPVDLDKFIELDAEKRQILSEADKLKNRRNVVSKEIGAIKKAKGDADELIAEMQTVSKNIQIFDVRIKEIETEIQEIMLNVPNIPHSSVPFGENPSDNVTIETWGEIKKCDFPILEHTDLIEKHKLIDLKRGAKITGSGFPVFTGDGARLQRALISLFLDRNVNLYGFTEISPPLLVNEDSARGTGQLPDKEAQMYEATIDKLFLIPTSEVPLVNLYRDEILTEEELPIYNTGYTPCFRREAGSYGKDVKGINRVHQFDKVELVKICKPEDSYAEFDKIVENVSETLKALNLPHRQLLLCTGDMGMTQTKTIDFEVWSPAQEKWLEVSSVSNCESYQARRANIRFRRNSTGKVEFAHTLNGSGLALPRTLIGILENNQQADGSILIPEALQKFFGKDKIQ